MRIRYILVYAAVLTAVLTAAMALAWLERTSDESTALGSAPMPIAEPALAVVSGGSPAAAALAPAPETPASPARTTRAESGPAVASAGMVVAIDPESGTLGMPDHRGSSTPTIEEAQAFARAEGAGLVTVRHADGSESIAHEGRFTDYSVVRIGPDGKPRYGCAHGTLGVEHALHSHGPVGLEDK